MNDTAVSKAANKQANKTARGLLCVAGLLLLAPAAAAQDAGVAETPSALATQPRGWKDIMPGNDLRGWTRFPLRTEVRQDVPVWKVDRQAGVLSCQADLPEAPPPRTGSHEMLRYDRELGDYIWHVEWRFLDPNRRGWNSGIYARISPDRRFWHQAQVGNASGGYWFGYVPEGPDGMVRRSLTPRAQRVKPVGEWNSYEITARGDKLTLWVNGAVTSEWEGVAYRRGHIGLEGEFHRVEFRNMRLKELRP
jgi:hypothetical protein